MQFTTAFAPSEDDLDEDFFGTPVLTMKPPPPKVADDLEAERGDA